VKTSILTKFPLVIKKRSESSMNMKIRSLARLLTSTRISCEVKSPMTTGAKIMLTIQKLREATKRYQSLETLTLETASSREVSSMIQILSQWDQMEEVREGTRLFSEIVMLVDQSSLTVDFKISIVTRQKVLATLIRLESLIRVVIRGWIATSRQWEAAVVVKTSRRMLGDQTLTSNQISGQSLKATNALANSSFRA
jgi:hypothetical protein